MTYAPTAIDLSLLPPPSAIEELEYEQLYEDFKARFLAQWAIEREQDPTLPLYDVERLDSDPVMIAAQAWSFARRLDRTRVNDAYKALLAQFARGSNLDAVVAKNNVQRRIVPATDTTAAIMEGDRSLLIRYLLSNDRASAGSPGCHLYNAHTAWPQSSDKTLGLWDARVNGRAVHGRRGDTDVVIVGPFGRNPTEEEMSTVRAAVIRYNAVPEATSVAVLAARRREYSKHLILEIPGIGPAPEVVRQEAEKRVQAAAISRTLIGGEVPPDLLSGAAYGENIINVRDLTPLTIKPDPYVVPVLIDLKIDLEVRS